MHICTYYSNNESFVIILTQPSQPSYMFKVNNRNTRTRCERWSKLTIKTPERRYFTSCSGVFVVKFKQVNAGWEDVNGFKSTGRVSSCFLFCP